jgi:hypothetical protein
MSKQWKELTDEIMSDLAQLVIATPDIKYIVGIVQWNGKIVSRAIYQPSPVEFVGDGGKTTGMSVMVEPPDGWKPIKLPMKPRKNGVHTDENMPLFYFLMREGANGSGLGIPSRFGNGKIGWSHSEEWIDYIGAELALVGTVTLAEVK